MAPGPLLLEPPAFSALLEGGAAARVCRSFVEQHRVALELCDLRGAPLLGHQAGGGDFCTYMGKGPTGARLCAETLAHLGAHEPAPGAATARACFTGLRYLVAPVVYDGDVIGRAVLGPFWPDDVKEPAPRLRALSAEFDLKKAKALMGQHRRASEGECRRLLAHFLIVLDALLLAQHKTGLAAQLHREAIGEAARELSDRSAQLAEAQARLEELHRLKTSFLATVSHELRTPLTSVIGYSEMLLAGLAGELTLEQHEYLKTIQDQGESVLRLISSILDLSRIEARAVQLQRRPTDLSPLVQRAVESVLPQGFRKQLRVQVNVGVGLRKASIDPDKIEQCLVQLLSNAVKFTPAGGQITVQAGPADELPPGAGPFGAAGFVQIAVEDSGVGIAPELLDRVFESFVHAGPGGEGDYGGLGLGLSIVKGYVEAHGGKVSVSSTPGKGSRFLLVLPVEPPPPRGT